MTAELNLDIATMEGKTWLAELTGTDAKFGFRREFINTVEKITSRSGKTGTASYLVGDGVYESNEGRKRLGRRYWIVKDGEAREVDRAEALAALDN